MRLHTMAAAIGLTLALAGCVSTGGLHPFGSLSEASALKSQRSLDGIPVSPAAWPQQDWWTGLGDSQLSALIEEALRDNPSLAAADARAQQAQAAAGIADAQRGPTVNGGASIAGARLPGALVSNDAHFAWAKYGYASFNWGLDLWGGKRAAWEAALGEARAAVAEADAQIARLQAVLDETTVRAPLAGRVEYRVVEVGTVLPAGGRVASMLNPDDIYFTIFLPGPQAGRLAIGAAARILLDAFPGEAIPARIGYVASEAQFTPKYVETEGERAKLMYRVKLQLPVEVARRLAPRLKAGMTGAGYVRLDPAQSWPPALAVRGE